MGLGHHKIGHGPAELSFTGYGGWLLHHAAVPWGYGGLSFRVKAPASWGDFLQVNLRLAGTPDDTFPLIPIEARHVAMVDGWSEVLVDWKELNPQRQAFDSVLIGSRTQVDSELAQVDRVVLTKPAASDTQRGKLSVQCEAPGTPISELIYGASAATWDSGQSAQRMGGNPLSRANWETGAWNAGNDWFFENGGLSKSIFEAVEEAAQGKHPVALVVPMLGWVSKDKTSFGFHRSKFPPQQKYDPYKADAGNGVSADGKRLKSDPNDTSIPAPPELIGSWVRKLVEADQKRGWRGVHMYILDNEPTLWDETHRDVHPSPLSYDELLDRTIKYASAIRDADPNAVIAGPAEWGFTGYMYSGVDREAGFARRPDRRAHGDAPLVAWYLKKLAEYERANNKRLLDVFDLHFYPAASGVYGGDTRIDPATADLRVRSVRALWDNTYVDESWIKETLRLIPRMKEWIAENYPGRKLSLGEWSMGADGDISGGVATAEALGRFGQQGLDAAFNWGDMIRGQPIYWAFRAFRDFDGQGGRFQDISLPTREIEGVSLFASRDAGKTRLVLVLVNRSQSLEVVSDVGLPGCGRVVSARSFSYARGSKELTPSQVTVADGTVKTSLPPFSFTVLDLKVEL